jgi:enolase-phosphatase E1
MSVILLDIEGTTTPVDFVTRTLFPYARARFGAYLAGHQGEERLEAILQDLRRLHGQETGAPPLLAGRDPLLVLPWLVFLMDHDRKVTPLKTLQGLIWEAGYVAGELRGEVYPDVLPAFQRWHAAGRQLVIYSSGSVQAQQLLFRHSTAGDLTPYLSEYFDTTIGPKQEANSYRAIAAALAVAASDILFLSDHPAEVTAAAAAGLGAMQVVRPPATGVPGTVRDFSTLF